ncbi:hypothetical protein CFIO01_12983 [Colletotrichum fioriniae PJ7]|uniref:N,N-dimethylformamidase beta subunit-like C-terminal domain-containing protein n=1 Tax=Colletotrichum fioriniae PJ7 TaxID=1445577 RepID=A0A010RYH7_9PEZI|nr:hypothetical protein CFIO01_12983 [Colletotrichum fioriniae PJ7]
MTSTAANHKEPTQRGLPSQEEEEIIGYVDPWIASPGENVHVKVSSTVPEFTWSLARIIQGFEHPNAPDIQYEAVSTLNSSSAALPGSHKKAASGSFALVKSWERYERKSIIGLRFSCYVQPWLPDAGRHQVLMSTLDVENFSGVAVYVNDSGTLSVYVGTGATVEQYESEIRLRRWKWAELHLSVSQRDLCIDVTHLERLTEVAPGPSQYSRVLDLPIFLDGKKPLTLAAGFFSDGISPTAHAANVFNGRLDSPHIQIAHNGATYTTWAKFDFTLDMSSDRIIDISGNANHGDLINAPTRAVKGFNWDGSEPDWTKAQYGYGAIHFHDDDLDDAAWATDFTFKVPTDALSGAYAVIVRSADHSEDISDHITFFVRPAATNTADITGPKVAIVLSTFTYLAYANEHMYDQSRASRMTLAGGVRVREDALWRRMARRTDLGCSLYDVHNDGSGCVFSTAKRPILNIRPGYVNWAFHRPREFSADQLMIGFLEGKLGRGGYDVLTDHDLHAQGVAALQRYKVVVTGCHPEYPSLEVLNAYAAFARTGGHLMYLGGNGFYWCSVLDTHRPHRLEVRKGDQGCRSIELPAGERIHSLNGAQGGLWRSRGRAPQSLFGVGSCACGSGDGVPYRFTDHVTKCKDSTWAWLLEGLESETYDEGEDAMDGFVIGTRGFGGGASGDEIDRLDVRLGTPVNTVLLATSTGHDDSFGVFNEEMMFPMVDTVGTKCDKVRSDMIMYEACGGGSVFSVGSINWYCSLGWDKYQNNVARLTWNVLREFMRRG